MGKIIKGPIEMTDSEPFGPQAISAEELFGIESDRLSDLLELVGEPPIDNLPAPINLQGLFNQTVEEAETQAHQIVSDAQKSAEELEANAHAEAEKIIQEAQAEAESISQEIREEAESNAVTIREEAHQSAFQAGQEEGKAAGYEEGKASGEKEGWEQGHQEYIDAINHLKEAANWVLEQRQEIVDQTESDLIGLVFDIAEKVVHHQISTDGIIYHTVKSMLEYVTGHEKVLIHVNPNDIRALEPHHDEFLKSIGGVDSLEIIEASNISQGGCLLETNLGTIDTQLETQLEQARKALNLPTTTSSREQSNGG